MELSVIDIDVCLCGTECVLAKWGDLLRPMRRQIVADVWRDLTHRSERQKAWIERLTRVEGDR